jgi:hypothetical protein
MNESDEVASIVEQINKTLHRPKAIHLVYFDILESFFHSLQAIESDQSKYTLLKDL